MAVGQHVVTVSIPTCLPNLPMSFVVPGGPGASTLPEGPSALPNTSEPATSSTAPSTPSSTPAGFLISYQAPDNRRLARRDVEGFPTLDGQTSTACIHSPLFNVNPAGQLSVVNAGTSMTYSTSQGTISAPFAPSSNVSDISTTWQLVAGTLSWNNDLFLNGTASLCSDPTGTVQAYFLAAVPADCVPISLNQAPVSACPGYFEANPNGVLAPFTLASSSPPSSDLSPSPGATTSQTAALPYSVLSPTNTIASQSPGSANSQISSPITLTSPVIGPPSSQTSSTSVETSPSSFAPSSNSVVLSQTTTPSYFNFSSQSIASASSAPSVVGNGSSIPTLPTAPASSSASSSVPNFSASVAPIATPSLPGISNSSALNTPTITSSFPAVSNATSIPFGTTSSPTISSTSTSLTSSTTVPTSVSSSSSSSSSPSSSAVSTSSVGTSSSSSLPSSSSSSSTSSSSTSSSSPPFIQVTVTSTVTSGSSLYTTFINTASSTVVEEIVQPTPFTTTVTSGSSLYTTTTVLPNGQQEVEVVTPTPFTTTIYSGSSSFTSTTTLPAGQQEVEVFIPETTTTTTSYTATTTIYTATNTGPSGQVTETVVQPTPGLQYFGFTDSADHFMSTQPDASKFNNIPQYIDVKGIFPADINFYTTTDGHYQFPGYSTATNAADYGVVFSGYFYGPPGDYAVTLSQQTDDYGYLWTESNAYTAWMNAGADITECTGCNPDADGNSHPYTQNHTFTLTAGQFVPMTIIWINVGGSGGVRFWIYPPGGGEVRDTTGWFVQPYSGDTFQYRLDSTGPSQQQP